MKQWLLGLGVCGVGLCTSVAWSAVRADAGPAPDEGEERPALAVARAEAAPARATPAEPAAPLGLLVQPVLPALAAQLGLAPGVGVLVDEVFGASPAAEAGLEGYDVIVAVDGEPARPEVLASALAAGRSLALRIVRGGVEADVTLAHPGARAPEGLLSSAALAPDHPFRAVRRIDSLRERYSETAKAYGERSRELEYESRAAREAARREMEALWADCDEEVAALLAARQAELLARVDRTLAAGRLEVLAGLRLELGELLAPQRRTALEELLSATLVRLDGEVEGGLRVDTAEPDGKEEQRARKRFRSLASEAADAARERLQRPLLAELARLAEHEPRLGPGHDERVQWGRAKLEAVRGEVRERVTCAVDRTRERFQKQLRERLQRMEVPAPGELEAALADVHAQLERYAARFAARTETAVAAYARALAGRPERLAGRLEARFAGGEQAARAWAAAVDAVLDAHLARPLRVDGQWTSDADATERADALAAALARALLDGRVELRADLAGLRSLLEEERALSDEAWSDFQRALGRLAREAADDCWKLDGPHLDGRFPRPAPGSSRGEVSLNVGG